MYTPCMLCGFSPFNIFVLIYQKKKNVVEWCSFCIGFSKDFINSWRISLGRYS